MSIFDQHPQLLDETFVDEYSFATCWTVTNPDRSFNILDVAVAVLASDGNFSAAARLLNRSRRSVETFVTRTLELRELQEDVEEAFLDGVEHSYRTLAKQGDPGASRFFLMTKAKDRGYATRNEMSGKNGAPIEVDEINARELLADRINNILTRRTAAGSPPVAVALGSGEDAVGVEAVGETRAIATTGLELDDVADHGGSGSGENTDGG